MFCIKNHASYITNRTVTDCQPHPWAISLNSVGLLVPSFATSLRFYDHHRFYDNSTVDGLYFSYDCYYRYLLTWGAGRFGQLGNDNHEDRVQFQNITPSVPPEAGKVVQVCVCCDRSVLSFSRPAGLFPVSPQLFATCMHYCKWQKALGIGLVQLCYENSGRIINRLAFYIIIVKLQWP